MYRSGYSYKDKNQERILALRMKHEDFLSLLEKGVLATEHPEAQRLSSDGENAGQKLEGSTNVQAEPGQKTADITGAYRLGSRGLYRDWVEKWIVGIEDVTIRARQLKRVLEEQPDVADEELFDKGLLPEERELSLSDGLRAILEMG
ncbi:hypothetical protein BJ170DRAFT_734395 [Xylariales sp. AK1849]|nr:hypothetical protein BJ170DRAFT_734395 [Xylariales sp. AK1849]